MKFPYLRIIPFNRLIPYCNVRSARPTFEYRIPLFFVEPIAELEAVGYTPLQDPSCPEEGHSYWAFMIP